MRGKTKREVAELFAFAVWFVYSWPFVQSFAFVIFYTNYNFKNHSCFIANKFK